MGRMMNNNRFTLDIISVSGRLNNMELLMPRERVETLTDNAANG